jgi:peroxiredoxin Q/BCP
MTKPENGAPAAPLQVGDLAPEAKLPSTEGKDVSLADYRGKFVALFFYPQDLTPTCSQEACDFRDYAAEFQAAGAQVIGVSPDPIERHRKFIAKYGLNYPLVSDPEHKWIGPFGVWARKKLYGREYMGLVRSTFLIGPDGRIVREWRNIRVKNHVDRVLEAVRELSEAAGGKKAGTKAISKASKT